MGFGSIIGHESVIRGLRAAVERDRVSHAYLFAGPDGVGKRPVAVAFFQLLSCTTRSTEPLDACGECRPCRLIASGRHPDLVTLERDGRFIKIDQVRQALRVLRFPPVEAKSRAILIPDAEHMLEASANALLKTLEEPSARNVFVLTSAAPNSLLATIRSRCQLVRFTALSRPDVAGWLTREHGLDAETADEVAAMSGGSFGAAAALVDPQKVALREEWLGVLERLPAVSPTELLQLAEAMSSARDILPAVLELMRIGLRDVLLRAGGVPSERLTFRRRIQTLPEMTPEGALTGLEALEGAEASLRGNVNPRMVAEHLLLALRRALLDSRASLASQREQQVRG